MIESFSNKFIQGDCETIITSFPSESINLVFCHPPYAEIARTGDDETNVPPDSYIEWMLPKAREFHRVLTPDGSFILVITDRVVHGFQHTFVFELILELVKQTGFHLVRDYIWYNPLTPTNVYSTGKYGRTKKTHDYCLWFAKSDHWTFNMDSIRSYHPRGKDPGTVLEIPHAPHKDPLMEYCKNNNIVQNGRSPEKLVEFFILAGTNPGDIVLDPFSGAGTTAISAQKLERKWIGIEIDPLYLHLSEKLMRIVSLGI